MLPKSIRRSVLSIRSSVLVPTILVLTTFPAFSFADLVPAKYKQGSTHAFIVLRSEENKAIGFGDLIQVAQGSRVHSRLVFRFRDGSVDEETTIYVQKDNLRLISDHHIQKGPSFPKPLDLSISVPKQEVTWREERGGKEELKTEHIDLPADLANGLVPLVIDNFPSNARETTVSFLTAGSKPRLVKLSIKPDGKERFSIGALHYAANRYNIHAELGGIEGVLAPFVGKQPPDTKAWVITGVAPIFARMQGPFYFGGPIWNAELASPNWP